MIIRFIQCFLFSVLILFNGLAGELDTLNGNIRFKKDGLICFEIPIKSVNIEKQKISYKSKFGSYVFKRKKQSNKHLPKIVYLSPQSLEIYDGLVTLSITINNEIDNEFILFKTAPGNQICFKILSLENERFFGGGVRYDAAELTDRTYVNLAEENGIGRGDQPISKWTKLMGIKGESYSTYYPVPFFCSNLSRGISFNTKSLFFADFKNDGIQIKLFSNEIQISCYNSSSIADVISLFNKQNGRGNQFPDWVLGTILGVQGGTDSVKDKFHFLKENNVEIEAVWIQDWVGSKKTKFGSRLNWSWELDTLNYSNIKALKDSFKTRVLGYINPFFVKKSKYALEGLRNDYLIKNTRKKSGCFDFGGIDGYMLDVFNEEAREWMKKIIKTNLIDNGFDGWMADFGEWFDSKLMLQGDDNHNLYVQKWIELNEQIITDYKNINFYFHRSGSIETAQSSQLTWYGDQLVDYGLCDGLPSVITAMQSSGLTGLPPGHSDIGGYTSVNFRFGPKILRSYDLLLDWMKLEAFTPVFRSHEGILPDDNLQVYSNDNIADTFSFYSMINRKLKPYFKKCIEDYRNDGLPVYRHPILLGQLFENSYQVYIGNDILIIYNDFEMKNEIPSGFLEFDSPGDRVSVFLRENSEVIEILKESY